MLAKNFKVLILVSVSFLGVACNYVSTNSKADDEVEESEWLIPKDQVYIGGGRDQIPSIEEPNFKSVNEIDFLRDEELILGIKIEGEIRGYPHQVMNYHEIVNDDIVDESVAITFCPLTGSALAWDRTIEGVKTTFGVSGFIYKNNLIAYDRNTESYWSQMLDKSVRGTHSGKKSESHQLVEMNWKTWKEAFPQSKVLTGATGFDRNYTIYPYGRNYENDNNNILFPIEREDERLERKTLAHGLFFDTQLHVIPIPEFPEEVKVINRAIVGNDVVIAGSSKLDLAVSYSSIASDGTKLHFTSSEKELPSLLKDDEGNEWNVFGECIAGERKGEKLNKIDSYNAYWFAWVDFFGTGPRSPIIVFP